MVAQAGMSGVGRALATVSKKASQALADIRSAVRAGVVDFAQHLLKTAFVVRMLRFMTHMAKTAITQKLSDDTISKINNSSYWSLWWRAYSAWYEGGKILGVEYEDDTLEAFVEWNRCVPFIIGSDAAVLVSRNPERIEWQGEHAIEISASADDRATAVLDVFKTKLVKRDWGDYLARRAGAGT